MEKLKLPHIGMRKIKSLIAVALAFIVWGIIRIFLPQLEPHPIFAYIYAIIEIRDTAEKSKSFGFLRIKATLVGLSIGLIFVTISIWLTSLVTGEWQKIFIDFGLILIATLLALCAGEIFNCKNFCGIAAIIAVICMVSHSGEDRYLYAIMRVIQTLIGVFVAIFVNTFVGKEHIEDETAKQEICEKTNQ